MTMINLDKFYLYEASSQKEEKTKEISISQY